MNLQSDLFGGPVTTVDPPANDPGPATSTTRTSVTPCGLINGRNKPCRQLGTRPVVIDGSPLVCRSISMVHCEPDCVQTDPIPVTPYHDNDIEWDRSEV